MNRSIHIVGFALALLAGWACTQKNESHCANQLGDASCTDPRYPFCDRCGAANDGCVEHEPPDPCHDGATDTAAGTGASSSGGSAETTVAGTEPTTTAPSTTAPATESSETASVDSSTGEVPCGNGSIDEGEDCDGDALVGATCETRGFPSGTLACSESCLYDEAGCEPIEGCHDGVVQPGEDCEPGMDGDPDDLGGQTCADVGNQFGGDGLFCNPNCTFNTSGCCAVGGASCSVLACCMGTCIGDLCLG